MFICDSNIYNVLSQTKISCFVMLWWTQIMILYDNNVSLTQTTIRNFGVEFIVAHFNENTQESLYIVAIYKPHT